MRFHELVLLLIFLVAYPPLFSQTLSGGSANPWKYEFIFPDEPFEQRHHNLLNTSAKGMPTEPEGGLISRQIAMVAAMS